MEQCERTEPMRPHQVILQDRRQLEMTGVTDVDSFDDTSIKAYTALGVLTVSGSGLHIRHLDLENGLLALEGQIDTLAYADVVRGGFFSRLFR